MIYLIDDNLKRQQDSGWDNIKFELFKEYIYPIYRLSEITENLRNDLFKNENNVLLFHESFFENFENKQPDDVNDIRNKLEKLTSATSNRYYVIFSGSNSERKLNQNNISASIPVHVLYTNLEFFISQYQITNNYNLKYLLYGVNPDIEQFLLEELNNSIRFFVEEKFECSNDFNDYFFFRSRLDFNPINENYTTILNKDSEFGLHDKVLANLSAKTYKGIFIPLCFGNSLCDYNGLRLATEIRCTKTVNQCTPIFIYTFIGIGYLIHNEYFNILKTKDVELVDYSKMAFNSAAIGKTSSLKLQELPKEIKKLELQSPKNYLDNHSIANEWAIYRWALSIKASDTDIEKVTQKVNSHIYFKYLQTVQPTSDVQISNDDQLKINYAGAPKILYIDDEANKGWYEIFCSLLYDRNGISFDYLDDEFISKTQNQIINICFEKIVTDDIDLVILDFRLHINDFSTNKIGEVTGLQLLKKLKKTNPGIQVIIFTASNKVWNLIEFQDNGADGFLLKESPELTGNGSFTFNSIMSFRKQIEVCISNIYLKAVWKVLEEIRKLFSVNPLTRYYPNDLRSLRGVQYQNLLLFELDSMYNILMSQDVNRFNYAMLIQFKLLECIVEIFIPEKTRDSDWLFYDGSKVKYYYIDDNKIHERNELLIFFDKASSKKVRMKIPTYEYNSTRNKIDCLIEQKLMVENKLEIHKKIKSLVNYRNSFIHPTDRLGLKPLNYENIVEWIIIIGDVLKKI